MIKTFTLGGVMAAVLAFAAGGAAAHHSFAAEFDGDKAITVTGIVTKIDWTNPHVWFYINVKDEKTGETVNWGAEMGPPHGLQRQGWRRETLKYEVTIDDAGAYTRPWSGGWTLRWVAGQEQPRQLCQENRP